MNSMQEKCVASLLAMTLAGIHGTDIYASRFSPWSSLLCRTASFETQALSPVHAAFGHSSMSRNRNIDFSSASAALAIRASGTRGTDPSASPSSNPPQSLEGVRDRALNEIQAELLLIQNDPSERYHRARSHAHVFKGVLAKAPHLAERLMARYLELSEINHLNPGHVWVGLRIDQMNRSTIEEFSHLELEFLVEHPNSSIQALYNAKGSITYDRFVKHMLESVESISKDLGIPYATPSYPVKLRHFGRELPIGAILSDPEGLLILAGSGNHHDSKESSPQDMTAPASSGSLLRPPAMEAHPISRLTSTLYHHTTIDRLRQIIFRGGVLDPAYAVDHLLYFSPVELITYAANKFGSEILHLAFDTKRLDGITFGDDYTTSQRVPLSALTEESKRDVLTWIGAIALPTLHIRMLPNAKTEPRTPQHLHSSA